MVSLSAAMLLDEMSRGGSSLSAEGVSDPRLIEQPQSAIAIHETGAATRRT